MDAKFICIRNVIGDCCWYRLSAKLFQLPLVQTELVRECAEHSAIQMSLKLVQAIMHRPEIPLFLGHYGNLGSGHSLRMQVYEGQISELEL